MHSLESDRDFVAMKHAGLSSHVPPLACRSDSPRVMIDQWRLLTRLLLHLVTMHVVDVLHPAVHIWQSHHRAACELLLVCTEQGMRLLSICIYACAYALNSLHMPVPGDEKLEPT